MKHLTQIAFATLIILSSCSSDNNGGCPDPEVVIVDGSMDFTVPQTFESCKVYYFTEAVTISSTVTIEPGAILKFKDIYTWAGISLTNNATGRIIAQGTTENPIIFTSDKDDSHGGDTNGDGTATSPAQGDWNGVYIVGDGSIFEHCTFLYGGQNDNSLIEMYSQNTRIDHCTFVYCGGDPDVSGKGVVHLDWGTENEAVVTNNIFYNNVKPMSITSNHSIDNSNIFHNPENPSQINQFNGIFVEGVGDQIDMTWQEDEVPFVYWAHGAGQGFGTNFDPWTFTIAPGVIIKFVGTGGVDGPGIWVRNDNGSIVNANAPGVFFTSYKDDAHGGDTNGDGNASVPMQGDWDGIYDPSAEVNPPDYYYSWGNILYAAN